MNIKIYEKHLDLSKDFKDVVKSKLSMIDRFFDDVPEVYVTASKEKEKFRIEITIHSMGAMFRCEETSDLLISALEEAKDTLKRQIRKYKTKIDKHYRKKPTKKIELEIEDLDEDSEESVEEETFFDIKRSKAFSIKPMYKEEAILQMNLLGHPFFVFKDAETNSTNIVYKRKKGSYGLITTN